jgi:hypothetical protein
MKRFTFFGPASRPISTRQPSKVFNINDGVLALCERNQAVRWVRWLSNSMPWQRRSGHVRTSNANLVLSHFIITAVLLFSPSVIFSQGTFTRDGLTAPNAHPRLFLTPSRVTTMQAWVTSTSYPGLTTSPRPLDDYDLAFTCFIMNVSAACTQVITDAIAISGASCSTSAGCDPMRGSGEEAMIVRDWLYPGCGKASCLTSGQVTTFDSNWSTWQTNQDATAQTWGNVGMPVSNYFCGQFRNDFDFGIASYIDNANAPANLDYGAVNRWNDLLNFVSLTGTGKNGKLGYGLYNQEGGGEYGRYCLNYYAFSLASSALLGRDMWQESTAFKSGVLQTIYNTMLTTTTGRGLWDLFTWADDETWVAANSCGFISHNSTGNTNTTGGCMAESQFYGDFMQAAATEYSATNIGKYARQWLTTVKPAIGPIFKSVDTGGSTLAFSNLPLDYYSSGAQYMYLHDTWASTGTAVLWQMGTNQGGNTSPTLAIGTGHWHIDTGTFQASRKGVNIIRETMGYSDTVAGYNGVGTIASGDGIAHNVPLVGGKAEVIFQEISDGPGIVKRLETQPNYGFAAVDLTLTYQNNVVDSGNPSRENQHAVSVVREFYYFRGINTLVILDRFQNDLSTTSTTFVSHCETSPTVVSATVKCVDGTQEAFYTALVPAAPTIAIVNESSNSATSAAWQYRIESNNSNPGNVVNYQINTIQLGDSGFSPLTPGVVDSSPGTPSTGTFTITLDTNDSIVVNKGIASVGGTIKANNVSNSLATTVENMTITDSGPVWGTVVPPPAPSKTVIFTSYPLPASGVVPVITNIIPTGSYVTSNGCSQDGINWNLLCPVRLLCTGCGITSIVTFDGNVVPSTFQMGEMDINIPLRMLPTQSTIKTLHTFSVTNPITTVPVIN